MKVLSSILFISILALNYAIAQNKVQLSINEFVNSTGLNQASVSFQVIDLATGNSVASYDPNRLMPTASTAKLFSTATALEVLGENYRPKTRVYSDGTIDSTGTLSGNLWIRGGGDPSLGSKYFVNKEHRRDFLYAWADSLLKLGVKQIDGSIIADASEFGYKGVPNGWNWVDLGNYYGAGPSGLTIFDNLVEFSFKVPVTIGAQSTITSISPAVPDMVFHNYVTSSSRGGDNAYIYGAPYSLDRFVTGVLPKGSQAFVVKGSLPDPEHQFAYEFALVLSKKGIQVLGEIKTARSMEIKGSNASYANKNLLITYLGQTIGQIINKTNERSVNLFAEHLTCLVGYSKTGDGSTESGLQQVDKYWSTKFNTSGMHVNDGSGLSRMNAISAAHFVGLLKGMKSGTNGQRFIASLPVAGVSGTMRNICKGQSAHNRLIAKSGSMTRIKSYAGYINSTSGKKYAFALIVNNQDCSSSALIRKMEVVFNKIATL
ncbi:MAG: D-alanyl-D-alanine carboxypeptidase/D-alanyl-D-alanine-endopeptidase (penicillin-binding protein 4) [Flavobacteriaceae bacterium]|jgi:D-alanyl-D-alanine carboxypeptidase/D-alanyl-D-alanine-endopeptidase (penicillin-binding protein 4)